MRTTFFLVMTIIASAALLVSATVWEGVTDVVSTGDLPGGSYSVATNSFPQNTIVDITNLENGKMVRVRVVSGLETTGLLATLSRSAADSINLRDDSTCRIRMTQSPDDVAFAYYRLGPITPVSPVSEPDTPVQNGISGADAPPAADSAVTNNAAAADNAPVANRATIAGNVPAVRGSAAANNAAVVSNAPAAGDSAVTNNAVAADNAPVANNTTAAGNVPPAGNSTVTNNATIAGNVPSTGDSPMTSNAAEADNAPVAGDSTSAAGSAAAAPDSGTTERAVTAAGNPPEISIAFGKLSLLPAEERPPEDTKRFVITGEDAANPPLAFSAQPAAEMPGTNPLSEFSPFPVPLIGRLEPDKWYVQVGVYTHPEYVEDEINRIGTAYPLAIQNVGTDTSPMFRVLLGPLNQGESGAMLQRFKSIGYTDAFVRHN